MVRFSYTFYLVAFAILLCINNSNAFDLASLLRKSDGDNSTTKSEPVIEEGNIAFCFVTVCF